MIDYKEVAQRIKQVRGFLSQKNFAKKAGVNSSYLSNVENNSIQTNFSTFFLFLESHTYSVTLNSSPKDYDHSLKEFLKSLETFAILSDPEDGISEKLKKENTQSGKQKDKKNK